MACVVIDENGAHYTNIFILDIVITVNFTLIFAFVLALIRTLTKAQQPHLIQSSLISLSTSLNPHYLSCTSEVGTINEDIFKSNRCRVSSGSTLNCKYD